MKVIKAFLLLFLILSLIGCAAHSSLVPLGKGNVETNISVGGPIIPLSVVKIPAPYISFSADYGVGERININGMIHVTAFFYKVAGFDFGGTWFPVLNEGLIPTWGIQPRFMLFSSLKNNITDRIRVYPLISNSAAWNTGCGLFYTGFDLVVPFTSQDYEKETAYVILSPFAGYKWKLSSRMNLLSEIKWQGVNVQGNQLAAEYVSPAGNGALSIMLSITRSF